MKIQIPEKAKFIINTIEAAGFEAYVVGGCVRDSILGRVPGDWDITTSAKPEQVKGLFRRTIDTGIQHGTVTVMMDKEGFEVTTYRIDGKYEDSRHPKEVTFTPNLEEDLKRRDFTINAMAYNESKGLIDIFGGMEDIQAGVIRCVGDATQRFKEDALRIMRAIRFSAQLGYTIEEHTAEAIRVMAPTLRNISAERIQVELVKLMTSDHPDYIRRAYELGVTAVVLPELDACMATEQHNPHHRYNVGEHILHSLVEIRPDKAGRLAMLFHDIGKPSTLTTDEKGKDHFYKHALVGADMAREILRRLKFDNDTIHRVCQLVKYHDYGMGQEPTAYLVRRAIYKIGEELFPLLLQVKQADIMAQSDYKRQDKLNALDKWQQLYRQILAEGQCVSMKTLAVNGRDLMEAGIPSGPAMGEILKAALQMVLEYPERNDRKYLMDWIAAGRYKE
ncbi:MAG: CCA tRNA nucleotidyltransferase [Lachnospiraceae bacterium]|nr:CCA tRNA nucleotidyltransferase [Lachnospiraceae bacterium]